MTERIIENAYGFAARTVHVGHEVTEIAARSLCGAPLPFLQRPFSHFCRY